MKKRSILISMLVIGVVAALIVAATTASFSDQVTTTGNTFTAGTLKLTLSQGSTAVACTTNGGSTAGHIYGGDTATDNGEGAGVDSNTGCVTGNLTFTAANGNEGNSKTNLAPGDSYTASYTLKNVGSLAGTLDSSTPTFTVTTADSQTGCADSNFTVTGTPPTTTVLNAGESYTGTITVTLNSDAPNVCQGATVSNGTVNFHISQSAPHS